MALPDLVLARYSVDRLKQWTNPDEPTAAAYSAGHLTAACDDAEGEFETEIGVAFDASDKTHVPLAVDRAIANLRKRMDPTGAFTAQADRETMEALRNARAKIGAGQRLPITTDSKFTPSVVDGAHGAVRPDMDADKLHDLLLDPAPRTDP